MEELAIVRQDSSQGKVSSQVENILVAETKVAARALVVNIATYSLRPGILISTIP